MNPVEPYNTTSSSKPSSSASPKTSLSSFLPPSNLKMLTIHLRHTVLVNNYFGRQFNSLNDVVVSRRNGDIYFTDTQYGYWQNFRPAPGLPNQVYRLNPTTGALTVVTDEFVSPNGTFFCWKSTEGWMNVLVVTRELTRRNRRHHPLSGRHLCLRYRHGHLPRPIRHKLYKASNSVSPLPPPLLHPHHNPPSPTYQPHLISITATASK